MKKPIKFFLLVLALPLLAVVLWKVFAPNPDNKIDIAAGKDALSAITQGEKLHYSLTWNGASAGKCSMQIVDKVDFEGQKAWKLAFEFHTEGFANTIINTHSKLESIVDEKLTRSLHHTDDRKGKKVRLKHLEFDWKNNFVQRIKNGEKKQKTALPGPAFDPLAMLYSFRAQPLKAGQERTVRVTDGKKCHECAFVVTETKLKINEKLHDTFLVVVDLKDLDTALTKGNDGTIRIWFSRDASQRLIKVESQLYGTLSLELIGADKNPEKK